MKPLLAETPRSILIAHALILVNGVFWLLFAIVAAAGRLPGILAASPMKWIMAILALSVSVVLGILALLLQKRKKFAFYSIVLALPIIAVLSITDEVGVLDILTLAISLAAFILIISNRSWYLQTEDKSR